MKLRRFNENDEFEQEPIEGFVPTLDFPMFRDKESYEEGKEYLKLLKYKVSELTTKIHEFENNDANGLIKELGSEQNVRDFVGEQVPDYTKFKYNGKIYQVVGCEDFIHEYGMDEFWQCVHGHDFNELFDGGSVGFISEVK